MATYTVLANFTDQGIRNVQETTHRAEAFEAAARKLGIAVKSIQWTLGAYDLVCQLDAPDDQAVTALGLMMGSQGNVRTQTMRTFSRDEMNAILAKAKT
jgi:uncharacterized protein with GYD domain